MAQFQAQIPHPLTDDLPGLLAASGMTGTNTFASRGTWAEGANESRGSGDGMILDTRRINKPNFQSAVASADFLVAPRCQGDSLGARWCWPGKISPDDAKHANKTGMSASAHPRR